MRRHSRSRRAEGAPVEDPGGRRRRQMAPPRQSASPDVLRGEYTTDDQPLWSVDSGVFAPNSRTSYGPRLMRDDVCFSGLEPVGCRQRRRICGPGTWWRTSGGAMRTGAAAVGLGAVVAASAVLAPASAAASSAGASDGGGTVSVGVSGGSGPGTSAGGPGRSGSGAGTSSEGGSKPRCVFVPLPTALSQALGVGGPTPGAWYTVRCAAPQLDYFTSVTEWLATSSPSSPPSPVVDVLGLALQAESSIRLPLPSVNVSPSPFTVVNLPTWLWVDPTIWRPYVASASAGGITAIATATPVSVMWSTGDGGSTTCTGPGAPYRTEVPASEQSPSCSYTYRESSAGQASPDGDPNDAAFVLRASVTWEVRWQAMGTTGGGELPDLVTSSTSRLRVEQIQSIGVG